jgi:hypothetical protein
MNGRQESRLASKAGLIIILVILALLVLGVSLLVQAVIAASCYLAWSGRLVPVGLKPELPRV